MLDPIAHDHPPRPATGPARRTISFTRIALALLVLVPVLFYFASLSADQQFRRACADRVQGQIGQAIHRYCNDNDGHYPRDLATLIRTRELGAYIFACPASDDRALEASESEQAATLLAGGHCSYVYVGSGRTSQGDDAAGANDVVLFELPDSHSGKGGHVLYGDWHVDWLSFEDLVQLVPELETGRNPPGISKLTPAQAKALYEREWLPKLTGIKNGTWSGTLPHAATRPVTGRD